MSDETVRLECPRCRLLMRPEEYESHQVLFCSTCWGYWLTAETLQAILDDHRYHFSDSERKTILTLMQRVGDVDRGNESEAISCPECGKPLTRKKWLEGCPVEVDQCPDHGVWLDPGEIKELQIFAESQSK